MFQKPQQNGYIKDVETMIAPGVRVEGEVSSQGNITVEGEVHGSIKTDLHLRVGKDAKISANVRAQTAYVSGHVQGNLKVKDKLEVTESATIIGDIETKTIVVAEGGVIHGKLTMLTDAKTKELKTTFQKTESKALDGVVVE